MGVAVVLVVLALVFFGLGLAVTALKWALIVGVVLFLAGIVSGFLRRGAASH